MDTNDKTWRIDFEAIKHILRTKVGFIELKEMKLSDYSIYMGNEGICDVLRIGKVKIFLPAKNYLYLFEVFFTLAMRRSVLYEPIGFE